MDLRMRALAGAAAADEGERLAALDREGQAAQDLDGPPLQPDVTKFDLGHKTLDADCARFVRRPR